MTGDRALLSQSHLLNVITCITSYESEAVSPFGSTSDGTQERRSIDLNRLHIELDKAFLFKRKTKTNQSTQQISKFNLSRTYIHFVQFSNRSAIIPFPFPSNLLLLPSFNTVSCICSSPLSLPSNTTSPSVHNIIIVCYRMISKERG